MLSSFENRNFEPMADGELAFARWLNVLEWVSLQHVAAGNDRRMDATHNVGDLFDESVVRLHSRWQRSIVKGLGSATSLVCEVAGLRKEKLQHIFPTHSSLVMSTLEDKFVPGDTESDKRFGFNMNMAIRQVDIPPMGNFPFKRIIVS